MNIKNEMMILAAMGLMFDTLPTDSAPVLRPKETKKIINPEHQKIIEYYRSRRIANKTKSNSQIVSTPPIKEQ